MDVYQAAHPGIAATVSAATASAVIVVLYKVAPIFDPAVLSAVGWIGAVTLVALDLLGLNQNNERRMVGYSSVAQVGLVAFAVTVARQYSFDETTLFVAAGGLLINHLVAKAGLFWSTRHDSEHSASGRVTLLAVASLAAALVGLPPFPGF